MQKKKFDQRKSEFEERVIELRRVTTVTKGGRQYGFSAAVVVGDKNGRVGIGTGKAKEVVDAIKKAVQQATKNVIRVSLVSNTKLNVARATLNALKDQKSISHVAKLRGKTESEILG